MKKILLLFVVLLVSFQINAQWVEQTSGVTGALYSVSAVDNNVAWICGAAGVVLRTTNGGTNWTNVGAAPVAGDLYNIWAFDATNALVTGSSASAFIWRTTNAGATWTQVLTQVGGFFDAIWMSSATNGLCYGDPVASKWAIFKTTNAGATWDSVGVTFPAGAEAGWNNAMYGTGNSFWIGTNATKVYYTSNYGTTWTAQATTGQLNSYAIWFNNATTGMTGNTQLVKTTNTGTTWTPLTSVGTSNISGLTGYQNQWYMVRQFTAIYGSTDNGTTWTTPYSAAAGSYYHISKARNGDVAWACRSNGGITKGSNVGLPVELTSFVATANNGTVTLNWATSTEINNQGFQIERKSANSEFINVAFVEGHGSTTQAQNYTYSENLASGTYTYRLKQVDFDGSSTYSNAVEVDVVTPDQYLLGQNYPNPFNPSTRINFTVGNPGMVKLAVFNLLGQEVKSLVNEFREAGTYNISFDASDLSSGAYFYKIETAQFSKTMKMLLTK